MGVGIPNWVKETVSGRKQLVTLAIVVVAGLFMVSGFAGRIVSTHDSFASSDRLAAISLILSGVPDGALPVTLLDIDDETRAGWGSDGATPHAALAELVRLAGTGRPEAVLVDFDLSMDSANTAADEALLGLLMNYPADAPLLMLVRPIGFSRSVGADGVAAGLIASAAATPYDAAAAGKPNIRWVTTLNEIGADRVVRRIRMWQSVCDAGSGTAYPSPALVTAAHFDLRGKHVADLDQFLIGRAGIECGAADIATAAWPRVQQQSAQLPYVFAGDSNATALMKIDTARGPTVALRRIGAGHLVNFANGQATPAGEIDSDPFKGRVVIIGASYTKSLDVHETPLGTMPGAMILANSIVQAQLLINLEPASPLLRNVMALLVFLVFAVFARYLIGLAAILGIGSVSVGVLVGLSRLYGVETGFEVVAAAITGFSLFKLIDAVVNLSGDVRKRGWQFIFK